MKTKKRVKDDNYKNERKALYNVLNINILNADLGNNNFLSRYFIKYMKIIIKKKVNTLEDSIKR